MGLSASDFGSIGGAVSDLFGGIASIQQGNMKAKGLNLQAQGLRLKATGDLAEASNYDLASGLAEKNKQYTETSTAIQQAQLERNNYLQIGGQQAEVAGAGFAASGSALDILRDSAQQGALSRAVLGQQGFITEAGYEEQSQSYQTMAAAARTTASGEMDIANKTDELASDTRNAGKLGGIGDFASAAIKIAPLVLAAL